MADLVVLDSIRFESIHGKNKSCEIFSISKKDGGKSFELICDQIKTELCLKEKVKGQDFGDAHAILSVFNGAQCESRISLSISICLYWMTLMPKSIDQHELQIIIASHKQMPGRFSTPREVLSI